MPFLGSLSTFVNMRRRPAGAEALKRAVTR
jgi:hypothetical protein